MQSTANSRLDPVSNVNFVVKMIISRRQQFTKFTFCGFSMGRNQYWAGRVYDLCVYYMTGTPEGSTESGFMENLLTLLGSSYWLGHQT